MENSEGRHLLTEEVKQRERKTFGIILEDSSVGWLPPNPRLWAAAPGPGPAPRPCPLSPKQQ